MSVTFHISELETVVESGQEVQVNSYNDQRQLSRRNQTALDLHNPYQANFGEAVNTRSPQNNDPPHLEPELPEGGHTRGRSKSAPAVMWVAMQYGQELRRMSDEFEMAYQGQPRPKSAGYTSELKQAGGWIGFFQGIFGQSRRKEDFDKPKKF